MNSLEEVQNLGRKYYLCYVPFQREIANNPSLVGLKDGKNVLNTKENILKSFKQSNIVITEKAQTYRRFVTCNVIFQK